MDIMHLKTFTTLAEHKTLTDVADALDLGQPAVTKQIASLEKMLNVKLISTSHKGAGFTEEGLVYLDKVRQALNLIFDADEGVRKSSQSLEGDLRLISTRFGIHTLVKHLEEFKRRYPQINLSIDYDDYTKLLRGSDIYETYVGIMTVPSPQNFSLVWQPFGEFFLYPYAHESYIARHGLPQTVEDLDHHRIIGYKWKWDNVSITFEFEKSNPLLVMGREGKEPRKPYVTVDDIETSRLLVEQGHGIGMLPHYLIHNKDLVPLLKETYKKELSFPFKAYYVFRPELRNNIRVKALLDFIKEVSQRDLPII